MEDFKVYQASGYLTNLVADASDVRKAYEEISGSQVEFYTRISAPLAELLVDINPVQDLHGQDAPYPAGGGKNKFNIEAVVPFNNDVTVTKDGGSFTVINNNAYVANMFCDSDAHIMRFPVSDGYYTISISEATTVIIGVYGSTDGENFSWLANGILPGATSATFIVSGQTFVQFRASAPANGSATIKNFQFEEGSSATPYAPYSNICPITGWAGCEVTRTGKNQILGVLDNVLLDGSGKLFSFANFKTIYAPIYPNTTYTFAQSVAGNYKRYALCNALESGSFIYNPLAQTTAGYNSTNPLTFTNTDFKYFVATIYNTNDQKTFDEIYNSCQLEFGSAQTDYEAPNITTLSVTFPSTVYGGKYEFVSGIGSDDCFLADLGDYSWSKDTNRPGVFYTIVANRKISSNVVACSGYKVWNISVNTSYDMYISGMRSYGGNIIFFRDTRFSEYTGAQVKEALAGVKAVLYRATPTEIQLASQEINTLIGVNNIWADTGDVSVKYRTH